MVLLSINTELFLIASLPQENHTTKRCDICDLCDIYHSISAENFDTCKKIRLEIVIEILYFKITSLLLKRTYGSSK